MIIFKSLLTTLWVVFKAKIGLSLDQTIITCPIRTVTCYFLILLVSLNSIKCFPTISLLPNDKRNQQLKFEVCDETNNFNQIPRSWVRTNIATNLNVSIVYIYNWTWANEHFLPTTTTILKSQLKFYDLKPPLINNHLLTMATKLGFQGWFCKWFAVFRS